MAKITKISDRLSKVSDQFVVSIYDNGFMVEASGRDHDGEWLTSKVLCTSKEELLNLIVDVVDLERDR